MCGVCVCRVLIYMYVCVCVCVCGVCSYVCAQYAMCAHLLCMCVLHEDLQVYTPLCMNALHVHMYVCGRHFSPSSHGGNSKTYKVTGVH